jgi:hypothetical protein
MITLTVDVLFFASIADGICNPSSNEDEKNYPTDDKYHNAARIVSACCS